MKKPESQLSANVLLGYLPILKDIKTAALGVLQSILDKFVSKCYSTIKSENMNSTILKNRLKVARAEKNISQEELANLVGVTRQTISSIETGQYCPSALLAFQLAKKLEKPVEELFFLEGDEK